MRNLHEKLMQESNWYNSWHSHRGHGLAHWFLFLFVALLITSAVSEGINKNYLSENLNMAAAVIATRPTSPNKASKPVPGQYIIVFKDDVKDPKGLASQLTKEYNGQLLFAYTKALKGFSAKIPDIAVNGLKKNPNIKYIEQDQTVQATTAQYQPPWGIDRIDQIDTPIDRYYNYNYTGAGVNAYIIDTGIRITHTQFEGRATWDVDTAVSSGSCSNTVIHWHGTHVAGTVGGKDYGVAKGVKLHSVRVLDNCGSGATSGVIAGMDWVANNKILPAVANMSLSGGFSQSMNDATKNLYNSGIIVAVAAGNSASDACTYSPSSEPTAITVGATTLGAGAPDYQSSFSNWGPCLDLYAPGNGIYSSMSDSDTAANYANGTSMASPHVAGVAALYLEQNPTATPSQVTNAILTKGSGGVLTGLGTGSVNLLVNSLFTGNGASMPTWDTQAPTSPTNLTGIAPDAGHVNLSWGAATDNTAVAGYKILRGGTQIGTSVTTSYIDNTVSGGTAYSYSVKAYDAIGNTSASSNTISVTTPAATTPPPAGTPVDIISYSVLNILSTSATVQWQTNIIAHGTLVITSRKEAARTFSLSSDSTNQYVYPTGLKPNTSYSYTITATDGSTTDTVNGTFKTRR